MAKTMNSLGGREARLLYRLREIIAHSRASLIGPRLLFELARARKSCFPAAFMFFPGQNIWVSPSTLLRILLLRSRFKDATWSPTSSFDSSWYLTTYPDVAASNKNAWVHYQTMGWAELRWPHPGINPLALESRFVIDGYLCATDSYLSHSVTALAAFSTIPEAELNALSHSIRRGILLTSVSRI